MKKRKFLIASIVILAAIVSGLLLYFQKNKKPNHLENAATIYINTSDATADIKNFVIHSTKTLETTIGTNSFSESWDTTLSCTDFGFDTMQILSQETLTIGKHKTEIEKVFSNGITYLTVNETNFSGKATVDDIKKQVIPAVLLDYNNYSQITGKATKDGYIISLSNATAIEAWANLDRATLINASGTAYISSKGHLTKSVYNLEYTKGQVQFRLNVVTEMTADVPSIPPPENTGLFIPIENLEGPILFERASGYLMQAENITTDYEDATFFEAFGDRRLKSINMQAKKISGWSANIETKITLKNDSRVGQDTIYAQAEKFRNGIYTLSKDGIEAQNAEITEQHMQTYCQNILVSTILLPQHLQNCNITVANNVLRIDYQANEEFAKQISANACQDLYQDATLLEKISQNNKTDIMAGYLELDSLTGIPISSGIQYESTYTTDNIPYHLTFQANQSYQLEE